MRHCLASYSLNAIQFSSNRSLLDTTHFQYINIFSFSYIFYTKTVEKIIKFPARLKRHNSFIYSMYTVYSPAIYFFSAKNNICLNLHFLFLFRENQHASLHSINGANVIWSRENLNNSKKLWFLYLLFHLWYCSSLFQS